jgi:hypothetical protein
MTTNKHLVPVRSASRLWYRLDAGLRAAAVTWARWRFVLSPILPL